MSPLYSKWGKELEKLNIRGTLKVFPSEVLYDLTLGKDLGLRDEIREIYFRGGFIRGDPANVVGYQESLLEKIYRDVSYKDGIVDAEIAIRLAPYVPNIEEYLSPLNDFQYTLMQKYGFKVKLADVEGQTEIRQRRKAFVKMMMS